MCGALASLAAHSCCCPAPGQQGDTGLITDDNCCSCNLAAMKEVPSRNIYCENYREISLRLTPLLVPGAPQQADRDRVRQLPRGCGRDSLLHQRGLRQARDCDHHPRNPLHEGGYLEIPSNIYDITSQDILTDLSAESELIPLQSINHNWKGHKVRFQCNFIIQLVQLSG